MHPYEALRQILLDAGLTLVQEQRHPGAFGSAWAVFDAEARRLRLVWDGKDGWGFLQKEGDRTGEWVDHGPRLTRGDLEAQSQNEKAVAAFRAAVQQLVGRDGAV